MERQAITILKMFIFEFKEAPSFNLNVVKKWYEGKNLSFSNNKNTKYEFRELLFSVCEQEEPGNYKLNINRVKIIFSCDEEFKKKFGAKK